eukprot:XP_011675228.1 PREDICTED: growth factor receptor-bound protein 14 [Strongylocentrotus purpuratus]
MEMMETSTQYHGRLGGSLCSINDHHMALGQLSKGNSSEDTSSDDVDLDALVNGMNSFPTYNEDRPLLASTESLNNHLSAQQGGLNGIYMCRQASQPATPTRTQPRSPHNQNHSNNHQVVNDHHHHHHHERHQLQHSNSLTSRFIPRLDREWRSKSMPEDLREPVATAPLSSSFPRRGQSESSSGGSDGDEAQVPDPFPELGGCSPRWKTTLGSAVEELFLRQKLKEKKTLEETNNNDNITQALVKVLSEDGMTKVYQVDSSHRVEEICRQMVARNHALNDKSWSLVEELPDLDLERTLEDHESVLEVYKQHLSSTNGRLHLRKDFRKYEMFLNPGQFFPAHMVADPSETADNLFEKPKRPRPPLLLDMLSPVETLPEIQGWLHIREGHKRSWKKHFCVLRESGLYYSSKGSSKDPRHLNHFVQLSNIEIYRALNPKKKYHAPTEFMFCTKTKNSKFSAKDLRLLCAEDEKTRQCWLAALRLFKHGEQLLENYQRALERTIKTREECQEVLLQNMKNCSDRVAMDFSGTQGRVIDNPSEAIAIARQEEFNWRRRGGQRSLDSPLISPRVTTSSPRFNFPPSSGGSNSPHSQLSSSPRHNNPSPRSHHNTSPGACRRGGINSGIHMTQPWFHSGLTRDETHALFAKQGMVDGMFLIRESQRIPGAFVLSFSHNQKVKHYQINMVEDGVYTIDDGGTRFTDLIQLVEFYQLNSGGLPTRLLHICTKL